MKHRVLDAVILPFTAGLVLLLDQISKHLVLTGLVQGQSVAIAPWLTPVLVFTRTTNTGAAFGLFPGASSLFTVVAVVVVVAIAVYGRRIPVGQWLPRMALGMQLGGALGNLTDRLTHGFVVDFIDVQFWPLDSYPIFNLADSCIVVGVAILFLVLAWEEHQEQVSAEASGGS